MSLETPPSRNDLKTRLLAALGDGAVTVDGLAAFDELHIGGRVATRHLAGALRLEPGMRVLDIGSGLGGAARYLAEQSGAIVTGIDLDAEYCAIAALLSEKVDLAGKTEFRAGNALALPYSEHFFDAAYSLHTAMNIEDRAGLYKEIFRVLKPGAAFVFYDVLAGESGEPPSYPLPWSADERNSFLLTVSQADDVLAAAGFEITAREDRTAFAMTVLERAKQEGKAGAIGLVYPQDATLRIANLTVAIEDSRCAVWQFSCRRPAAQDWKSPKTV